MKFLFLFLITSIAMSGLTIVGDSLYEDPRVGALCTDWAIWGQFTEFGFYNGLLFRLGIPQDTLHISCEVIFHTPEGNSVSLSELLAYVPECVGRNEGWRKVISTGCGEGKK